MKHLILLIGLLISFSTLLAQDPAILDLESTEQGILIPRMTDVERDAIANPVQGLLVYQTTAPEGFYFYSGTEWKLVGESAAGTIQGTGVNALNIRATDQGTTAGSARGENSVDLQSQRNNANQVASGANAVISGGSQNRASGAHSSVGGGKGNSATGSESTVSGGLTNTASGIESTVGGGQENTASGNRSAVSGGRKNETSGLYSSVGGGNINKATKQGAHIGGGQNNTASGNESTVGGGNQNTASGNRSAVTGGNLNKAQAEDAFVGGGQGNTASGKESSIAGGFENKAMGIQSNVGGGFKNEAVGDTSSVSGGSGNKATGARSFIGSGFRNEASARDATVAGGEENIASGSNAAVGGGEYNEAAGTNSTVAGGDSNLADDIGATVGGGTDNWALDEDSTVGGGFNNTASDDGATVSGGALNEAAGEASVVGGGVFNFAHGEVSTISGGEMNIGTGNYATIPGGIGLAAQSMGETVVGMYNTPSLGDGDMIVPTDPIFVVGNGTSDAARSNAMVIEKDGDVGIGVDDPQEALHVLGHIMMVDGNQAAGKVMTSDANGKASWQTPAGGGGTDDQTLQEVLAEGNSANSTKITDLADPTMDQDAATKKYVDDNAGASSIVAGNGMTKSGNTLNVIGSSSIIANADDLEVNSSNTANQILLSSGTVGTAAVFGALPLGDVNAVSGTLNVSNGGTGATTHTSGNVLVGAGTSPITSSKSAPTGDFVGTSDAQTLTNKSINADQNTITNIDNVDIKSGAGIDASKIADGSVSNTEFQQLNGIGSAAVAINDVQTLTNKTLTDDNTFVQDNIDNTKKLQLQLSGITTATTRTLTVPDANTTLVGTDHVQTLTNKSINADQNTITNIDNADIKSAAGIDASKIADGSVSNTEFQQLNGIGSAAVAINDVQTITNKTLTSATNDINAKGLHSASTVVDVSAATAPTAGQVLTATSGTAATWQTPSGGSGNTSMFAIKTMDQVAADDATLVDDTDFVFALEAGKTYKIEGSVEFEESNSTTNGRIAFSYTGTATISYGLTGVSISGGHINNFMESNQYNVNSSERTELLYGIITTTTAGTLTFRYRPNDDQGNTQTLSLNADSFMVLTKLD